MGGAGHQLFEKRRVMADVISLNHFKSRRLAHRAFRLWRRFFPGEGLWNEGTAWKDLPGAVLLAFASESDQAQTALYDFIMVCQGLGNSEAFESQDLDTLCRLLNGYFYLIDQARFEVMARLGWVERPAAGAKPLLEAACDPTIYETAALAETPPPRPAHPEYEEDRLGIGMERPVLVRKAVPEAIRRFREALVPETAG